MHDFMIDCCEPLIPLKRGLVEESETDVANQSGLATIPVLFPHCGCEAQL